MLKQNRNKSIVSMLKFNNTNHDDIDGLNHFPSELKQMLEEQNCEDLLRQERLKLVSVPAIMVAPHRL